MENTNTAGKLYVLELFMENNKVVLWVFGFKSFRIQGKSSDLSQEVRFLLALTLKRET